MANYNNYSSGLGWKILSLFLALIIVAGVITGVVFWQKGNITFTPVGQEQTDDEETPDDVPVTDEDGNDLSDGETHAMPSAMNFSANSLVQALAAGESVDVKITATVYPSDAPERGVDFSVAWGSDAELGDSPVSDYLTVTPDSDGSATATVSCFKAFGDDTIVITVTTRDGGFTDTCIVSFVGKASALSIDTSTLSENSSSERGTYYEIGVNKSYSLNINMSNIFEQVCSDNLSVEISANGTLWFGDCYNNNSAITATYSNIHQQSLSDMIDIFLPTHSVSGTTLSFTTGKKLVNNYCESSYSNGYDFIEENRYVIYDVSGITSGATADEKYEERAQQNQSVLPTCYFTITVKDSLSGLSDSIRVWLVSSVTSVSLTGSLTF